MIVSLLWLLCPPSFPNYPTRYSRDGETPSFTCQIWSSVCTRKVNSTCWIKFNIWKGMWSCCLFDCGPSPCFNQGICTRSVYIHFMRNISTSCPFSLFFFFVVVFFIQIKRLVYIHRVEPFIQREFKRPKTKASRQVAKGEINRRPAQKSIGPSLGFGHRPAFKSMPDFKLEIIEFLAGK